MQNKKCGVLLVNLGTPKSPEATDVRAFLKAFLSDKRVVDSPRLIWLPILYGIILTFRPRRVAVNYRKIWTEQGSPLMVHSIAQQQCLQARLETEKEAEFKVSLGMTYGDPSIDDAVGDLLSWGAEQIIVLPLYPQFSYTTTAPVTDQLAVITKAKGVKFDVIENYCDHPLYIDALASSVTAHLKPESKLVMSFHGIPKRYVTQGDPYQSQCEITAQALAAKLNLREEQWEIAYQSRVGREPWLTPYLDERMAELAAEGSKDIVVMTPGFSSDCLETLEEVAMENREYFLENGGDKFTYVAALNASPEHIEMMADLVCQMSAK
jgi:protoporphyrin/coproporphyrin ferrochelatase